MPKLLFATLYTDIVELRTPGEPTEGGTFEMPVEIDTDVLRKEPSPKTYFFREIGIHLSQATLETGIPREYWNISFEPIARREFNLSERQKF